MGDSTLKPIIQVASSSTGHLGQVWSNITIGDLWSFDGWHTATSLAERHPDIFVHKSKKTGDVEAGGHAQLQTQALVDPTWKPRYSNPDYVPEKEMAPPKVDSET